QLGLAHYLLQAFLPGQLELLESIHTPTTIACPYFYISFLQIRKDLYRIMLKKRFVYHLFSHKYDKGLANNKCCQYCRGNFPVMTIITVQLLFFEGISIIYILHFKYILS